MSVLSNEKKKEYLAYIDRVISKEKELESVEKEYKAKRQQALAIISRPASELCLFQKREGVIHSNSKYRYKGILDKELPSIQTKSYREMTDSQDVLLNVDYPRKVYVAAIVLYIVAALLFVIGMVFINQSKVPIIVLSIASFFVIIFTSYFVISNKINRKNDIQIMENNYLYAKKKYVEFAPNVDEAAKKKKNCSEELDLLYEQNVFPPAYKNRVRLMILGYIFTNGIAEELKEALWLCEQMAFQFDVMAKLKILCVSSKMNEKYQEALVSQIDGMFDQMQSLSTQVEDANKKIEKLNNQ